VVQKTRSINVIAIYTAQYKNKTIGPYIMHNRTEDIGYKQNIYKNYFKI